MRKKVNFQELINMVCNFPVLSLFHINEVDQWDHLPHFPIKYGRSPVKLTCNGLRVIGPAPNLKLSAQ